MSLSAVFSTFFLILCGLTERFKPSPPRSQTPDNTRTSSDQPSPTRPLSEVRIEVTQYLRENVIPAFESFLKKSAASVLPQFIPSMGGPEHITHVKGLDVPSLLPDVPSLLLHKLGAKSSDYDEGVGQVFNNGLSPQIDRSDTTV